MIDPAGIRASLAAIALLFAASPVLAEPSPPERAARDVGRAARLYLEDTWHVTTSPARFDRRTGLYFGGFVLLSGVIYAHDQDILDAVQRNKENDLYDLFQEPGRSLEPVGHMGKTMKYYFGGVVFSYLIGWEKGTTVFAQLIESHGIAGMYKNLANLLIGRSRPFEEEGPYFYKYNSGTSFPSGHASNIFQVATILSHHADFLPFSIAAYTVAASVAMQRLESESHWPSDVFVGAVYGTAVARAVIGLHEGRHAMVVPHVDPEIGSAGLSFSFPF